MDGERERGVEMGAGKKCEEANGQLVLPLVSFIPCHSQFQFHLLELLGVIVREWTDGGFDRFRR